MAPRIKVEIAQMDLIGQVFDRQQTHMQGVGQFVRANCGAQGAFTGVLGLLEGHYRGAYDAGTQGMSNGATIAGVCSEKTAATRSTFVARDQAAYERIAAKQGINAPYEAPRGGTVQPGAPIGGPGTGGKSSGPFDFMKQFKDWVGLGDKVTQPLHSNVKNLWKVKDRDHDLSDMTDPKYWIQRKIPQRFNDWSHGMDGMTPTERGNELRRRQREAYENGQDWSRDHVPGREDDRGSRSPAGGAMTDKDAGRFNTATKVLQLPGAVVGEGEGLHDTWDRLHDIEDQQTAVRQAEAGPKNDGAIKWATKDKGGTW